MLGTRDGHFKADILSISSNDIYNNNDYYESLSQGPARLMIILLFHVLNLPLCFRREDVTTFSISNNDEYNNDDHYESWELRP